MTLAVSSRNDYVGTGLVDTYDYGFKIFAASDLQVTTRDTDDVEAELAYPADFDVTGVGDADGGTIVLTAGALADDFSLTIRRVVDLTQETDIRNQQGFFPETLEDTFDKLTMIDQQQQDELDRAMKLSVTVDASVISAVLPPPGAGRFIRWNTLGTGLEAVSAEIVTGGVVNVKDYGAKGDGVTDDTAAFSLAISGSNMIYVPAGTYRVRAVSLLSNRMMYGDGEGATILKAIDGAVLDKMLIVPATASVVKFRDITFDGNRSGQGMLDGTSAVCHTGGSRVKFIECEIKGGTRYGAFVGNDAVVARDTKFLQCYVHDNGGVVDDTGFGVGIGSGGVMIPEDITIDGGLYARNYNTVTKPGDSTGCNLTVKGVYIGGGVVFADNFNVNGGQIAVNGFNQTFDVNAVITDYRIISTTTFGTPKDRTFGIEIQGRGFAIGPGHMDLRCDHVLGISGVAIGGDASHASGFGTITGVMIDLNGAVSTGIDLDPAGLSSGITNVVVSNCVVKDGTIGVNTNAAVKSKVQGCDFESCSQSQGGTVTATMLMVDNMPYGLSNSANGRRHSDAVAVVAANNLTLGNSNDNEVSGNTQINLIDSRGWYTGDEATLYFTGAPTVKSGQAASGNFKKILLAGGADFSATDKDTLRLKYNGVEWAQVSAANNA